jgi:hypothetical protein
LTAIKKIDSLLQEPKDKLSTRIQNLAQQYRNFEIAEKIYAGIYGN